MPTTTNTAVSSADQPQAAAEKPKTRGRAADTRNAKVPTNKPVAAVESVMAPQGGQGGLILGTVAEVDYDERRERVKADIKAAKAARQERIEAATAAASAEPVLTEAAADFSPDVRPDFTTMDEEAIMRFMRTFAAWLRLQNAVVRGPKVTAHQVDATSATTVTREGSADRAMDVKKETMTVYEGFFEWQYEGSTIPVTIRRAHVTAIEALRDCATEAFTRRMEA